MANRLPAYIIKDVTILAADRNQIGQATEITIPVMEKTVEEIRYAGMIKPREVTMGYEATSCSFKGTSFDPDLLKLYGIEEGRANPLIVYKYMESEDGSEHSARFEMNAEVKKIDVGSLSPASKGEIEYELIVHSGILYHNDKEVYAFDDFSFRVDGRDQRPGRRDALRLA